MRNFVKTVNNCECSIRKYFGYIINSRFKKNIILNKKKIAQKHIDRKFILAEPLLGKDVETLPKFYFEKIFFNS